MGDNGFMRIPGHVTNGVVVLDGGASLPDGTAVTVSCESAPMRQPARKKRRVRLPLIKFERPGAMNLTNEEIARILDDEDTGNYGPFFRKATS